MDTSSMPNSVARTQTERENPFNRFDCDTDVNETDLLHQIKGCSELNSMPSIDIRIFSSIGIDLSADRNLEDFVRLFDDAIKKSFKVELGSDDARRQRCATYSGSDNPEVKGAVVPGNGCLVQHASKLWRQLIAENSRLGIVGWHKPYATQVYLRCLLKQRQRVADNEVRSTSDRYSMSMATESTKALLDTRRRSRLDEQFSEMDENELRACFDLHSLITAELPTGFGEPFKSADEVLAEIDQLIQDGGVGTFEADSNISPTALELLHFKEHSGSSVAELESNLRNLSVGALSEYLEELEVLIRQLSEQLVQELADREEIDFERELKSEFISLMNTLQKQQKDALACNNLAEAKQSSRHAASKSFSLAQQANAGQGNFFVEQQSLLPTSLTRLRKISWSTSNVNPGVANDYIDSATGAMSYGTINANLFTQIPYHASSGPPDCELLQRFNMLLRAVVDNHANVPQLLTDYILNVYAPPGDTKVTIKLK